MTLPAAALVAFLVASSAGARTSSSTGVVIELKQDDAASRATRDQMLRLLERYDLSRWRFTGKVIVDSDPKIIPHSHPVLTLDTGNLRDDELLVSTYIHEQLHWFMNTVPGKEKAAIADLREIYPDVPAGRSGGGARDEHSTYLHLIVCYLEIEGVREVLGELRAWWVLNFWAQHHYTWIYRTIGEDRSRIGAIIRKHGLEPPRPGEEQTPEAPSEGAGTSGGR